MLFGVCVAVFCGVFILESRYAIVPLRGNSKFFLVGDFVGSSPVRDGERIQVIGYLVEGVDGLSVSNKKDIGQHKVGDARFGGDHESSILAKSDNLIFDDRAGKLIAINNGDFQNNVLILDVTYNKDGYQQSGVLSSEEYFTIHRVSAP